MTSGLTALLRRPRFHSMKLALSRPGRLRRRSSGLYCPMRTELVALKAGRGWCNEFRRDRTFDAKVQNCVDFALACLIDVPAADLADRVELLGTACPPQRDCRTLIEHPAHRSASTDLSKRCREKPRSSSAAARYC